MNASDRTPYDTGARAEPALWVGKIGGEWRAGTGGNRPAEPGDFGRVDFDSDNGDTIATVYGDRQEDGSHILTVYAHDSEGVTVRETAEDANVEMREALRAWREAEAAFAAACAEEEETGREVPADAYYARDDAAVTFADAAADWIAARLGVTS